MDIILPLVNNSALLLSLSIIYEASYIFRHRLKKFVVLLNGILIGLIGIAIMTFPFELLTGVFFDTRSILISVAALIFGFGPASIAAGITLAYRFILGGVGSLPGCIVIIVSLIIGLLFRRFVKLDKRPVRWLKLYIFGIAVHVAMLLCMLLMPWDVALFSLEQITLPIMLIYPIGVVLLAMLMIRQTEYNEAYIQIEEAESLYKSLFYNNNAAMILVDPYTGNLFDANAAAAGLHGWTVSELKSMSVYQLNTLPQEKITALLDQAYSSNINHHLFKHRLASGQIADVEVYSGSISIDGHTYIYSILHDVSVREAALAALKESEERFRLLVENSPEAIFLMHNGTFSFINKAGLMILGITHADDLLGKSGTSVIHPDYHPAAIEYMNKLEDGTVTLSSVNLVYVQPDGTPVSVESTAIPIVYKGKNAYLVIARDITDKIRLQKKEKEMEAQLRQQQKLEAIGTLAGGVAHEINNPLNGIMNYAQLILDAMDKPSGSAEYAREIIHETERISLIVKNLLQFSRQEKQSHSYASIYDIIDQTISLVNTVILRDQITLDIQLPEGLPDIKCRSQQIQQVLMNLLTNARDALNEKYPHGDSNKVISVEGSLKETAGQQWLSLTVLDYGSGIPAENRDKIFEPFYSTKPKELGTGLGLSISYGIVSEHKGALSFESEPGEYTKFILDLPVDNGWTL